MAQYDDFSNPPSRSSSPEASGSADRFGGLQGGESSTESGRNRPSSVSRNRNQWRQYKHMTPDFGLPKGAAEASNPGSQPAVSSVAKPAALPSFNLKGGVPQGSTSVRPPSGPVRSPGGDPSLTLGLPSHPGVQTPSAAMASPGFPIYSRRPSPNTRVGTGQPTLVPPMPSGGMPSPGSFGLPAAQPPAGSDLPSLRSRQPDRPRDRPKNRTARRSTTGLATGMAALAAATTAGLAALATPPSQGDHDPGQRRFAPQRRLATLPMPALYLLRLAILGIGVAAIAGTLLSVFSPSNVASTGGETAPTAATAPRRGHTNLLPGQGAVSIAAIQPSSEITRLKAQLEQLATLTPGLTPAIYAFDMDSGRYVDLNGTSAVAAASTIKMPILVAFLQQVDAGNLALNQSIVLQEHHRVGGSGTMVNDAVGSEYTALDVATRMIIQSDNTATNMMIETLGGQEALNQQFATWGLEATVLRNPLPDLEGTNTISSRDLALLMALVDQGDVLSRRSRERLLSIMQRTANRSLIAYNLTDGSLVANKTGDIASALGDVALVDTPNGNRYVLAIMVQRPNNDGRASELIRRITETIHQELSQPLAPVGRSIPPGEASPAEGTPTSDMDPAGSPESLEGEMEVLPGDSNPAQPTPSRGSRPGTTPSGEQIPPG
ncbi:MAG: serine hydrolase [Leptolyngbya sp.]|nr:serine hydrolase [Leptolyngbya sp.]